MLEEAAQGTDSHQPLPTIPEEAGRRQEAGGGLAGNFRKSTAF